MKELEKSELMELNGGVFGWDDLVIGIIVGSVIAVINDWDNFERGFKGQAYKAK